MLRLLTHWELAKVWQATAPASLVESILLVNTDFASAVHQNCVRLNLCYTVWAWACVCITTTKVVSLFLCAMQCYLLLKIFAEVNSEHVSSRASSSVPTPQIRIFWDNHPIQVSYLTMEFQSTYCSITVHSWQHCVSLQVIQVVQLIEKLYSERSLLCSKTLLNWHDFLRSLINKYEIQMWDLIFCATCV